MTGSYFVQPQRHVHQSLGPIANMGTLAPRLPAVPGTWYRDLDLSECSTLPPPETRVRDAARTLTPLPTTHPARGMAAAGRLVCHTPIDQAVLHG